MNTSQEVSDLHTNLAELREDSLKAVSFFAWTIGWAWLVWTVSPLSGRATPPLVWLGLAFLGIGPAVSYALRTRYLSLATHILVWSILAATVCAVHDLSTPAAPYLFALPVIFAGVLLSQPAFLLTAVIAGLLALAAGLRGAPSLLTPNELTISLGVQAIPGRVPAGYVAGPVVIIAAITFAVWLAVRNLHAALIWVWNGYESARRDERTALDNQGELRRVLKALDETTYRLERANYMLALARDQAEEARRLKQQFAQTISHELRTPLNLIVGFTDLMTQSPEHYGGRLSPAYVRDLSIVNRNACHLQTLVNDVLDLARIEAAQMSLIQEMIDPAVLVREAVETSRGLVESRGLTLKTAVETGLPPLRMDPTRIRQVLFNLLNNAARFTDAGSIEVGARQRKPEVVFYVADTGVGIAPEELPRIFEEFHQADGSYRGQRGGAGLGLAISKRFVELHGGRIWAESQVGRGSTFYFSLASDGADRVLAPTAHTTETPGAPPAEGIEGPALLVVSESPSAATLLTRYVHGCRAVVVANLEEGRRKAQQLMPQAITIDRACADLDPAALESLARQWGLPRTPFLLCPLPGKKSLREQLAVDGYLVKPVSRQDLWDTLRRFGEDVDRVLVVDDDRDFVRMLGRMLDSPVRRYQMISAFNGQEGLAMLQHQRPDLVLLDLVLQDMNGLQVVELIRSNPLWQRLPIIIVSAQEEIDHHEPLRGIVTIAKAGGFTLSEMVQWTQSAVDMAIKGSPFSGETGSQERSPETATSPLMHAR